MLHLVISANATHLYKGSYLRHPFVTHRRCGIPGEFGQRYRPLYM
jgi:hypothetical protein